MDQLKHEIIIDGKKLLIEIPFNIQSRIQLESYAPFPKNLKGNPMTMQDSEEFKKDIINLAPKTLVGSPLDNSVHSLHSTLQMHIEEFGQLLPADLFSYIDESIFVIFQISEQFFGEKMTRQVGKEYFKIMFDAAWLMMFSDDIRDFLIEAGERDRFSGAILNQLLIDHH